MKKILSTFLLLFTTIGYANSQTVVKLALPDNCNKAVTSIKNLAPDDLVEFKIMPNPNNGVFELYMKTEKLIGHASIKLINLSGEIVYNELFYCNSKTYVKHFQISGLAPGVYVLFYKNAEKESSTKIIIK